MWTAEAAAVARTLPRCDAIGPVQLKPVLPDVHVYNVNPEPPRYVFRLVGTRMAESIGQNMTGKAVADIPTGKLRLVVGEILGMVESRRAPIHIKAPRAIALPNGDHHSLESVWMPFGDDGTTVTRIIAVSLLGPSSD
jgi:hypothetical protein